MAGIMDKLLKHTPDIDESDGQEYPWSIAIKKIKNKRTEWLKIEQQLNKKKINQEQREQFIKSIMGVLIDIKTERFLNRGHDKYDTKEQLLDDLKKIRDDIQAVQKHFWHREYHDVLNSCISSTLEDGNFLFENGRNKTAENLESIENNLEDMRKAADKAIEDYTKKDSLRPNFSTFKKKLKNDLAFQVAKELQKIDVRPTKTRNGIFDKIFCACCDIISVEPNKPGSKHIERAVGLIIKN